MKTVHTESKLTIKVNSNLLCMHAWSNSCLQVTDSLLNTCIIGIVSAEMISIIGIIV